MYKSKAPIVLFVYNRPWHAEQCLESLASCEGSDESELFIYCDGPKLPEDKEAVERVRELVKSKQWCKDVHVIERKENWGLAKSIITGVTDIIGRYGRIIVLEDDLLLSPQFLNYMNDALDTYEEEEAVMHVSGSSYPVGEFGKDSTYFLHIPLCWGWATWRRAWSSFRKDISIMDKFDRRMINEFDFDGSYDYWLQLKLNRTGRIDTWFIFWYACIFLQQGLSLFPQKPVVKNIGHDGSGVHCRRTDCFDVDLSLDRIEIKPVRLEVSKEAFELHKAYFRKIRIGFFSRIINRIKNICRRLHI